jgi:hypothetical protein
MKWFFYHYKSISEQLPVATCGEWRQGWTPLVNSIILYGLNLSDALTGYQFKTNLVLLIFVLGLIPKIYNNLHSSNFETDY